MNRQCFCLLFLLRRLNISSKNLTIGSISLKMRTLSLIFLQRLAWHAKLFQGHRKPNPETSLSRPLFGCILKWVSEVGDEREHTEWLIKSCWWFLPAYMAGWQLVLSLQWAAIRPVRELDGNCAVGYARVNIHDRQKRMWTSPWSPNSVAKSLSFAQCREPWK
jgi:hypothetical protein